MIHLLFAIALFMGGNANGGTPPSPALQMTLGGVGSAAAALPVADLRPTDGAILAVVAGAFLTLLTISEKRAKEASEIVRRAVLEARSAEHPKEHHIGGQPIGVEQHHPFLSIPDFRDHEKTIWSEIKEIRKILVDLQTVLAAHTAVRDGNGQRLEQLAAQMRSLQSTVDTFTATLREWMRKGARA